MAWSKSLEKETKRKNIEKAAVEVFDIYNHWTK